MKDELDPGTVIGTEVGPARAVPATDLGSPVVRNDAWVPTEQTMTRWCLRPGGIVPRLHRPEHFIMFDPGLPRYRRCTRCGQTVYIMRGRDL